MRYQNPDSVFQTSSSPGCPLGSFPVTPDLVYRFQATTALRTGRSSASTSTAEAPISAARNRFPRSSLARWWHGVTGRSGLRWVSV